MIGFLTDTEFELFYPQAIDYDATTKANALSGSAGLVNSYLNTTLKVPEGDKSPYILKIAQSQFARYILEFGNVGETDDVRNMYNNTADMVKAITQNELSIPTVTNYPGTVGFNIVERSVASTGYITIRDGSPNNVCNYKLLCTTGGQVASGNVRFSVFRDDNIDSALVTNVEVSLIYNNVLRDYSGTLYIDDLEVSFSGQFTSGDYFIISAVPYESINETVEDNKLQQGYILY